VQSLSSTSGTNDSSSSVKWKCRLPEEHMTGGIIASKCGKYVLAGGKSGNCYCWSILNYNGNVNNSSNGNNSPLLRIWNAHYRSVTSMAFSDCGSFVFTGGGDGIVNVWSLMDIVSYDEPSFSTNVGTSTTINPIRTWSEHHLPVTSIHILPSSRAISTSLDRNLVIMELFSQKTVAKIAMPCGINTCTSDSAGHRIYLGATNGSIYCIDLDSYAIATTAESATIISGNLNKHTLDKYTTTTPSLSGSLLAETILGLRRGGQREGDLNTHDHLTHTTTESVSNYLSELCGHEKSITCLALLEGGCYGGINDLLISGSDDGSVRLWDIRSRCCTRVFYPWSSTNIATPDQGGPTNKSSASKKTIVSPCSTITILPRDHIDINHTSMFHNQSNSTEGSFLSSLNAGIRGSMKNDMLLSNFIQPLQRFLKERNANNGNDDNEYVTVMIKPARDKIWMKRCDELGNDSFRSILHNTSIAGDDDDKNKRKHPDMQQTTESDIDTTKRNKYENVKKNIDNHSSYQQSSSDETENEDNVILIDQERQAKDAEEIARLKRELEEARETIERWQKVNNKLAQKLKKSQSLS
jgi:WD40 repeat protein